MHLSGKRRTVTDAEMEEFKKQVQCLGLPAPAVLNTETGMFSYIVWKYVILGTVVMSSSMNIQYMMLKVMKNKAGNILFLFKLKWCDTASAWWLHKNMFSITIVRWVYLQFTLCEMMPHILPLFTSPWPISLLSLAAPCPEDSQSQETQTTDLTDTFKTMGDGLKDFLDELLRSRIKDLNEADQ